MKICKSFGFCEKIGIFLTLLIFSLILLFNYKWAFNFLFGFLLEAFNMFNQRFSLNYILKKQKNPIMTHWILFSIRYFLFGILLIVYILKSNPNIILIFTGIIISKIIGLLHELDRLKEGDRNV